MYRISKENADEIYRAMEQTKNDVKVYRRLQAVFLRFEGMKNSEIAKATNFYPDQIGKLIKKYCQSGLSSLLVDGRKGGNNRNATAQEEKEFLKQFEDAAEGGQIITVEEIAFAYDKRFKKKHKSKSTVYYLLHKSGWRKVMPRSKHPNKASEEAIEASKKLTIGLTN